jgi:hypothetical protein
MAATIQLFEAVRQKPELRMRAEMRHPEFQDRISQMAAAPLSFLKPCVRIQSFRV